jgi:hypothetical protein
MGRDGRSLLDEVYFGCWNWCIVMDNYYVYVYIDPRNYEEFYYGKGKGSRKEYHLLDNSDSEKTRRISLIVKAGLVPSFVSLPET